MSCATSKTKTAELQSPLKPGAPVNGQPSVESGVDATMRRGMHALAQPITLLHSYFYLARLDAGRGVQMPQHFEDAGAAVEHLCTLFHLMQEILHGRSGPLQIANVSLEQAIAPLLEGAEAVLAGSGSWLLPPPEWKATPSAPLVAADPKLLRQAWTSMLHVVRESCRPGSEIRCSFSRQADCWAVCLAPSRLKASPVLFDEASKLHLALATISLQRQGGELHRADDPFSLHAHLPVAE